jgi:hypothetical protein
MSWRAVDEKLLLEDHEKSQPIGPARQSFKKPEQHEDTPYPPPLNENTLAGRFFHTFKPKVGHPEKIHNLELGRGAADDGLTRNCERQQAGHLANHGEDQALVAVRQRGAVALDLGQEANFVLREFA